MEYAVSSLKISTKTKSSVKNESIKLVKDGEIKEYKVRIEFEKEESPSVFSIIWEEPQIDMIGFWSSKAGFVNNLSPDWMMRCEESRSASGMPIACLFNKANDNRMTIALSDPMSPAKIMAGVVEENGNLRFQIDLFSQVCPKMKEYEVTVRIDKRSISLCQAIKDARKWYHELGYKNAYVPMGAKMPLYSAWYSFHQNTIPDQIIEECKKAKEYGMDTLIVDDGWQTEDGSRGYAFCGDWEICKSKIPDMKYFVDEIHKLGMKFMIWFSVPFVGTESKNFEKFKGKYLNPNADTNHYTLDPRFPEVREFLVNTYVRYVKEYGWDGLKLDFIDSFKLTEDSSCDYENMDFISLEEAVNELLRQAYSELTKINPEFLIEFRQSYIGPVVMQYGNMIRVGDCPNDALTNRKNSIGLRLTCEEIPVHSDMLMWNKADTNESVMYQLLGVMFSVPQISIRFDNITNDHKMLLKNFLTFWKTHSDTILSGELTACDVEASYSMAKASKDGESVAVLYQNVVYKAEKDEKSYIFNSTGNDYIYLELDMDCEYEAYDMMGNVTSNGKIKAGVQRLNVENCGMIMTF